MATNFFDLTLLSFCNFNACKEAFELYSDIGLLALLIGLLSLLANSPDGVVTAVDK